MFTKLGTIAGIAGTLALTSLAQASYLDISLPGTSQFDGWAGLNNTNFPGYGSYPGTAPWPSPIGSNVEGSGAATFDKISGGAYVASASVYAPLGATFEVAEVAPIDNLETIVFQLNVAGATSAGFADLTAAPTLDINGGAQAIAATWSQLVSSETVSGGMGTSTNNFRAWQWDLSDFGTPITSYSIQWAVGEHAQIFGMEMNQGDTMVQAVPEPGVTALLGMAGLIAVVILTRRRRVSVQA